MEWLGDRRNRAVLLLPVPLDRRHLWLTAAGVPAGECGWDCDGPTDRDGRLEIELSVLALLLTDQFPLEDAMARYSRVSALQGCYLVAAVPRLADVPALVGEDDAYGHARACAR